MPPPADPSYVHLVVASEPILPLRAARQRLLRVVRALQIEGGFSITPSRQQGVALLCAFERTEDADRLAALFEAKPSGKYDGWQSQRTFKLGKRALKKIDPVLIETASARSPANSS